MIKEIEVKSVLNKAKKRDDWFLDDYTFNPYQSCSYNCIYCYIRGSKYGTNLATSLSVKVNAIELLEKQLKKRSEKGEYGFIVLSSVTDPYINIEKEYMLTRKALEVILKYKFPVHIITKSTLVERDFDLLQEINQEAILPKDLQSKLSGGTLITFSFSTVDDKIGAIFEPGAPKPSLRIETLQRTLQAGFHSGVSLMPLLPFITDTTEHLEKLFSTFKECQAQYVMPATLTVFGNGKSDSKTLMMNAIRKHFPELEARYLRYFSNSHQLPEFYRNAFYTKMKELAKQYDLKDRII
ncbi:radical SAM protein [Kordia sp. YSTF-M3]|uniref:Radical SAM protein n=1 Tax=Kordia aestuariivivens TaxID=2759037 RepID=A0ABR7QGI5_9FLAO|nr:radical SAM protein [Kordia aestuariivivens]MBC8757685.1 radical SAM protein [Kordia aestuariivivens]